MNMFKNKIILISGGTGSFGNAFLNKIINAPFKEVRVFSRDEKKQNDLRNSLKNENIKFYIGDVRDKNSVFEATKNVDYIFHAAALKQVPSCEFYPLEAIKTNILGTQIGIRKQGGCYARIFNFFKNYFKVQSDCTYRVLIKIFTFRCPFHQHFMSSFCDEKLQCQTIFRGKLLNTCFTKKIAH